jgi:hypothetical protein
LLLDLQLNGVSQVNVKKSGQTVISSLGSAAAPSFIIGTNAGFYQPTNTQISASANNTEVIRFTAIGIRFGSNELGFGASFSSNDTILLRDGAPNTLALRNSTAAQTFNVYGTYTSGSAYSRLAIACDTSGNATLTTQSTGTAGTVSINGVPVGLGKGNVSTNIAIGGLALITNVSNSGSNVAIGYNSLATLESGNTGGNTAIGAYVLTDPVVSGSLNSALGYTALQYSRGNDNTAIGAFALRNNNVGNKNTALGRNAGDKITGGSSNNDSGSNSLFLGMDTKALGAGQTNQIVIGYDATGLGSNTAVLGNASITTTALRGNVGIGTTAPSSKLHVVGDAVLTGQLLGSNYTVGTADSVTQANIAITNNHVGFADSAIVITPKGVGAFILGPKPDGTATGGNARGNYAVDLQLSRSAAADVANGPYSCIGGGQRNVASGAYSVVGGGQVTVASGSNSFAGGGLGVTASGNNSFAGGGQSNTAAGAHNFVGGGQSNASSGSHSVISGGLANIVSGNNSCVIGGQNNNASAGWAVVLGGVYGLADRVALLAHSAGRFSNPGDAQRTHAVLRNKTTTNSAVELFIDGVGSRYTVTSGKVISMLINITGTKSDGTAVAHYLRQYSIKNVGGTTSQVYAAVTVGTDNAAGTSIALSADDTNDSLKIEVTGVASETWRWVASVDAVEVGYGV